MGSVKNNKLIQKKIQTQNMIIIALIIIIVVLLGVSGTAAWYIRTKTDSADIILSNPVNIYITEFKPMLDGAGNPILDKDNNPIQEHVPLAEETNILKDYNTKIYPGDKIKLNLGLQIGNAKQESSEAYVRVKLVITYTNILTGEQSGLDTFEGTNMVRYKDKPNSDIWELVDFNKFKRLSDEKIEPDYWYVLKTTDKNGDIVAKIAYNLEQYEFLNGYIELDKQEVTNKHANCKFHINYVVEAIQHRNVPNPLQYEGYGPWWDFVLGDNDNIDGWENVQ